LRQTQSKDPEELNPVAPHQKTTQNQKNRHFDRSCSRFCEQRSGEIRFSTQTASQPLPRLCHCGCRCGCLCLCFLVVIFATGGGSPFVFALALVVAFLVVIPQGSAVALAVACSLDPNPKNVISTEAAHAFVSSAAEKSAPPPKTPHSITFTIPRNYFRHFPPKNRMSSPKPT
jgi:hypothetical protein